MKIISKRGREAAQAITYTELSRCKSDPVYFINNYFKYRFGSKLLQITLLPHQEEYVMALHNNTHTVAMMPRCQGLTTISLAFLLWEALFNFDKTIMSCSYHRTHVADQHKILSDAIFALPPEMLRVKAAYRDTFEFANGSKIFLSSLDKNTGRGFSLSRVFIDNFALAKPDVQHDALINLMPCLISSKGKMIVASTPNGTTNTFYKLAEETQKPNSSWSLFKKTIYDVNMSATTTAAIKITMSEKAWKQEQLCEFVED